MINRLQPGHPSRLSAGASNAAFGGGGVQLSTRQGESLVRLVETAPAVSSRSQFFVWSQGPLHALLPHQAFVCGAYSRQERALVYAAFQSVVLAPPVLAALTDGNGPFMRACVGGWLQHGGRPLVLDAKHLPDDAQPQGQALLQAIGPLHVVVHGATRPQRPAEVESLFVLLCAGTVHDAGERASHIELLTPYLHATWRRVLTLEAQVGAAALPQAIYSAEGEPVASSDSAAAPTLTEREREILMGAREGKSNQEIGLSLGISALTVKNHIQKILRKLGAHNRAHAVALAMSQDLFSRRAGSSRS